VTGEQLRLDEWLPGQRPARARKADPLSSHASATAAERSGRIGAQMAEALDLVPRW